jgi:hypothetical protein
MGILWDWMVYESIRLTHKHCFVVSKKMWFLLLVSTHTEEYISHTVQKDVSGIGGEYLHVFCIGFSILTHLYAVSQKGING